MHLSTALPICVCLCALCTMPPSLPFLSLSDTTPLLLPAAAVLQVWGEALKVLPARDGVPTLMAMCTIGVARQEGLLWRAQAEVAVQVARWRVVVVAVLVRRHLRRFDRWQ